MINLNIVVAENGFIVQEGMPAGHVPEKQWAFESAGSLAKFIKDWGEDNTKKTTTIDTAKELPIKLEKGKALVITGGKGAGKSALAYDTACHNGTYTTVFLETLLKNDFQLGDVLVSEPDVLIVEDQLNEFSNHIGDLKAFISSDKMTINIKGQLQRNITTPKFIFCTGAVDPLKLEVSSRRFTVLNLNNQ